MEGGLRLEESCLEFGVFGKVGEEGGEEKKRGEPSLDLIVNVSYSEEREGEAREGRRDAFSFFFEREEEEEEVEREKNALAC